VVGEPDTGAWYLTAASVKPRRGMLTHRGRRTLLLSVDVVLICVAVIGALAIWAYRAHVPFSYGFVRRNWIWMPFMLGTWLVAAAVNDLYRPNLASHLREVTLRVFRAEAVLIVLYLLVYFLSKPRSLPRGVVVYSVAIATPLVFAWRWLFSVVFHRPRFRLRTLIVGAGWAGRTLADVVKTHMERECELVGFVDDDPAKQGRRIREVRVLGDGNSLVDLVNINEVDLLLVAITHGMRPELFRNILACQQSGIGVVSMSRVYEQTLERTPVEHLSEKWFLEFEPPDLLTQAVKRTVDLGFALLAMLAFAVIFPFIALAVYLDCPGPIFYKQRRVGRNGKLFWVYKVRSMVPDAERDGARWAQKNDSRVTRVGRILRRTRLDELPQVWNILKGDMSLVGPRPERPEFVAELEERLPYYLSRLSVKPGLTGWAQVRYRYGSSVEDAKVKLEYDLYYVKHQSLLLDLSIILRTVGVVLTMRGT